MILLILFAVCIQLFVNYTDANDPSEFFDMSLEELMDVEVAFVMKNVFDEEYYTIGEKSYKYDTQRAGRSFWMTLT